MMNKFLKDVAEFMITFKQPVLPKPTIPGVDRRELRVSLIDEELKELEEAIMAKDIVAIADALCDLQYVLSGAVLEFGLGDKFDTLFDEVQRSNMSKACNTQGEAFDTIDHHLDEHGPCHTEEHNGKWIVYRTKDNKVMKSKYYSPANLEQFLK